MHVHLRFGRDIEDSEVIFLVVNISHDTAHTEIAFICIFLSVVCNLGISDDDIADFCKLRQVGGYHTDFDDRSSLWDISFFLLNQRVFNHQVGNCSIFFLFRTLIVLRIAVKSCKQAP